MQNQITITTTFVGATAVILKTGRVRSDDADNHPLTPACSGGRATFLN
jgi:hypothetical protein